MTKKIVKLATVTSLLFLACKSSPKIDSKENKNMLPVRIQDETEMTDISFILAKRYFVNNTVKKLDNPKIETAEKFDEIFGSATLMGEDGIPTQIDFKKQYVIAVILPVTNLTTTINPVSLQKDKKGKIILTYKTVVGQNQGYLTRPFFQIIVEKTENGNIELKEQK